MNAECLLFIPIPKNVQSNSVPKLVVARNVLLHWNPTCFGFLQNVMMKRLMMNGDKVAVRAGLFVESSLFCVRFNGSEFNPINATRVSDFPR